MTSCPKERSRSSPKGSSGSLLQRRSAAEAASRSRSEGAFLLEIELDAAIQGATVRRVIRRDRVGLAVAVRGEPRAVDALAHQVRLHRLRAALGQGLVVGLGADRVG